MTLPVRQTILLIDDDRQLTAALTMALECTGRTVVACADVEAAEIALECFDFTDVVTDVQFSGQFGFEGLHFVDRIRTRVPAARMVLMTGYASDALRLAAAGYGASAFLCKPFDVSELEAVLGNAERDDSPFELVRVPSVDEILAERRIETTFQPIVSMTGPDGEPFAFEALARLRGGWPLAGIDRLFEYAVRRGRAADLNRAAIISSIESASALPQQSLIFVNVDPPTFSDPDLGAEIVAVAAASGIALHRVVLEITERCSLGQDPVCLETFQALREAGVRFALDDHASAYSHLTTISMTRPSFIKISSAFGTGFELDDSKQRVIRNVQALAQDFGCSTVLEGIETQATATAARLLGIELAQGYFFSIPRDASHWSAAA
jgi:EAL domain-containing protein (putative c-di-GMP-specific phosphodiesterase class I)